MINRGSLSYAYFGSGLFAARCLELLGVWKAPSWVVTAPPRSSGRGGRLTCTPVGDMMRRGVCGQTPLIETGDVSSCVEIMDMKKDIYVDFIFVVDFGQIIREPILGWDESIGCLNIHPSMLPLYRGAAPVQRALMDGAAETGVTVFKLARGMDSGPVLLQKRVEIKEDDNYASMLERAAWTGASMFIEYADNHPIGEWTFTPQDDARATYAPKIKPEEERIDWNMPAGKIFDKIRALSPKPGAWTTIRGKRLRILTANRMSCCSCLGDMSCGELDMSGLYPRITTGDGVLELRTIQMEGKKIQSAVDWKNGLRARMGECFA
ncbi:MAG: methionyl-tRNA formyltransferase [Synergistaceae bacterium]|jgi:methionyl-tRNA formyltransferase|nr:methionyl-tRNA formyltransferase [Synergistaceae bacterium]